MITVNSISGGKSSAYIAVNFPADYTVFSLVCIDDEKCKPKPKDKGLTNYVNRKLEKYIPEYGEFIATAEDDMTLTAMRDLEQFIGKEIIWVRGKSYDDVIDKGTQTRLPSWARRYCTEQLKLYPIFIWWFRNIGELVEMRIGFRFEGKEFDRMINFFNYSDPTRFSIPVSCRLYGKKTQKWQTFTWRKCTMPLIKAGLTKYQIYDWVDKNLFISDLFYGSKKIEFPVISNCVGCFHKKDETIAVAALKHPEKIRWFAKQEKKNMGTWFDSKITYEEIINNAASFARESLFEMEMLGQTCDSGGCTD